MKCKEGCAICTNEKDCGTCDKGYFVKKTETKKGEYDAECGKCIEGCKDCFDEKTCISWKEGYYKVKGNAKDENVVCSEFSEKCLECSGNTQCIRCDYGYLLVSSGHSTFCEKLN